MTLEIKDALNVAFYPGSAEHLEREINDPPLWLCSELFRTVKSLRNKTYCSVVGTVMTVAGAILFTRPAAIISCVALSAIGTLVTADLAIETFGLAKWTCLVACEMRRQPFFRRNISPLAPQLPEE